MPVNQDVRNKAVACSRCMFQSDLESDFLTLKGIGLI